MADEAGLVRRAAGDRAAAEEAPAPSRWGRRGVRSPADVRDGVERRLVGEHRSDAGGAEDPTLVGPVGMEVDDGRGEAAPVGRRRSRRWRRAGRRCDPSASATGRRSSIVARSMPRRAALATHTSPYGPTSNSTLRPRRRCGRWRGPRTRGRPRRGARTRSTMSWPARVDRRHAPQQRSHLGQLGHAGIDAGQGVGLVVDDNGEDELVERLRTLVHGRIMPVPGAATSTVRRSRGEFRFTAAGLIPTIVSCDAVQREQGRETVVLLFACAASRSARRSGDSARHQCLFAASAQRRRRHRVVRVRTAPVTGSSRRCGRLESNVWPLEPYRDPDRPRTPTQRVADPRSYPLLHKCLNFAEIGSCRPIRC